MTSPATAPGPSDPRRLNGVNYFVIGQEIFGRVLAANTLPAQRDSDNDSVDSATATLYWPDTPAGNQLRLVCDSSHAGTELALYVNGGSGERIVASWRVYQSLEEWTGELVVMGTFNDPAGNRPADEPLHYHLDQPIAARLPGFDPTLPPLTPHVISLVLWWQGFTIP
jgi:hypothetical protein